MDLYTNNHSVFKLNYYLVLVIKYRRKVVDDEIKKDFPHIRKWLWKQYFRSRSYFLITTDGAPIEVIKNILKIKEGNEVKYVKGL